MANVVPISVAHVQSLLHQKSIGITYAKTSNFRMELVQSVPYYSMAMPQPIIIVIEVSFVSALINTIVGITSKPHTPRGIEFVNLHEDIPKEVNRVFINRPLDQGKGDSNPLGPPGYFGLLMVHPGMPPLPPSRPYHRPLDYPKYVKDFDLDVHVRIFKATIRTNSETDDVKIVNMFNFTFKDIVSNWCNNYLGDYPYCTFIEL